jgi:TetR/AcrR family transcriptional regulator, regulator of cefoperazone and chloramphenicol sensitivity
MNGSPRPPAVRGEGTRGALLEAATRVFGRDGFHAATTKAIASEAGVNQALISYHFGGKEGLYVAAMDHIVESIGALIGPVAVEVDAQRHALDMVARAAGTSSPAEYFELLCRIVDRIVDILTAEESTAWAKIVVREQQEPSPAFDLLYTRLHGRVLAQAALLVARIRGRQKPTAADRLAVVTLFGQVLVFRVARATAARFLEWEALTPREVGRVKRTVRANMRAILGIAEGKKDA